MSNQVIAFIGKKGSGKDTAARVLIDQRRFTNVKFAGGLKEMLRAYLAYIGVDDTSAHRLIEGDLKELPTWHFGGKTTRWAMQTLGTEWGRDLISKDLWVSACIRRCQQFSEVVVTDARFENEVAALQGIGAKIIRVTRPGSATDTHESERLIDTLHADFEIVNDSTIDVLHEKVLQLI